MRTGTLIAAWCFVLASPAWAQGDEDEAAAESPVETLEETAPASASGGVELLPDTRFELHGYARMPLSFQTTPRQPYLIDNDYFLSGFSYTRLYEPDWTELFLSAHYKDYVVKFGLFASLYSDYATTELENQFGIAQASVAARRFLDVEPLTVEIGVFWDRFGHIEPYDTYIFGRTHQGGFKVRYDFTDRAYVQVGAGVHQAIRQQNQGMTPVAHVAGGIPVGPVTLGAYLLRSWTRDKPKLSPIQDGDLWVAGLDARVPVAPLGHFYAAAAYYKADKVLFLAPALELLHSTGGRGLTENYLGLADSDNGTGSFWVGSFDFPAKITSRLGARLFGMTTYVRSEQASEMPLQNKDDRLYLKWGIEPGVRIHHGIVASVRYDRVILDMNDAENSFRVLSPRVRFPLADWGELSLQYSRYFYGDKIQLRPGQVPLETEPDENAFKIQAQAIW